jgi:hypothetical protein
MATNDIADLLSTPLEELLVALGRGIGRSQAELDRHSIDIQRTVDEDPVLADHGVAATWYRIPSTELELKISVAMEGQVGARTPVAGILAPAVPKLWVQPVSAGFQNQFEFDVQAASVVRLTIVAVPPPGPAAATRPVHSEDEALATARRFLFPTTNLSLPPEDRVTVNFNPGARAWYVIQSRETATGTIERRAFVKVDDDSLTILRHDP